MAVGAAAQGGTRGWLYVGIVGLFVCSGTMQPLLISTLGYNGAYDKSTLLFLLPNYVGMSLAGLLRLDSLFRGTIRARPPQVHPCCAGCGCQCYCAG